MKSRLEKPERIDSTTEERAYMRNSCTEWMSVCKAFYIFCQIACHRVCISFPSYHSSKAAILSR
jgi:hypothetical protein